jgi:hypothetical protein
MLYTSYYLAKIIGLNMVIISLALLFKPQMVRSAMETIFENRGQLFLFAILNVIVGAILINLHNLWVFEWQLVITLIAWIVFLRGVTRLFFPYLMRRITSRISFSYSHWIVGVCALCIGLFLLYQGYFTEL